jgi:ribosomal protein L32
MPPFQAVRPEHVLLVLEEFDRIGADEFLSRYGFDQAGVHELVHNSSTYDSLAVLGVAHLRATGELASDADISGGAASAAEVLRGLGFTVEGDPDTGADQADAPVDASEVGEEAARTAWALAAREVLVETAGKYHAVITSKELAAAVMTRSKIHTKRPSHYWIGDVLGRVATECAGRGEPLLSALCVAADGSVGASYATSVASTRGSLEGDADDHAARERLECYRYFGADLPSGGGVWALTPRLSASRSRERRAAAAEKMPPLCPKCHTAVPSTGICDYCD